MTIRVLHIEDDAGVREYFRAFMGNSVVITEAVNGAEGLKVFAENKDGFDLIICDHQMPVMNGVEAIKAIRKISSSIPIVGNSSMSYYNSELEGAGANTSYPKFPSLRDFDEIKQDWMDIIHNLCTNREVGHENEI